MRIYRYWAKETAQVAETSNGPAQLSTWRGSNTSEADARRAALEALAVIVERFRAGGRADGYLYADRPLREEIVEEIGEGESESAAVITRNAYGSLVLNTKRAMFVDVDGDTGIVSGLTRLFSSFRRRSAASDHPGLDRVRKIVERRPELNVRVYRTFKGLRCLVTDELYDPTGEETRAIFDELGADPLYVRLCSMQECFRARLTPKHWRCGVRRPPCRFPWEDSAKEQSYREWEREYEARTRDRATCELIDTIGSGTVTWGMQRIIDVHDSYTRPQSGARLA